MYLLIELQNNLKNNREGTFICVRRTKSVGTFFVFDIDNMTYI